MKICFFNLTSTFETLPNHCFYHHLLPTLGSNCDFALTVGWTIFNFFSIIFHLLSTEKAVDSKMANSDGRSYSLIWGFHGIILNFYLRSVVSHSIDDCHLVSWPRRSQMIEYYRL